MPTSRDNPLREPKHGTRNEYVKYGCRCDACRDATRLYDQQRRERNPAVRQQSRVNSKKWRDRNPEMAKAAARRWRDRNPERQAELDRTRKERHRLKRYALDAEMHAELLVEQNGVCAVCQSPDDRALSIDHDHGDGRVRGLLCRPCNLGIGCLGDDPAIVKSAIAYLRRTSQLHAECSPN